MLLRRDIKIINSISVDLFFDDDTEKKVIVNQKDIVNITYNKAGTKSTIIGKVVNAIINANREKSYLIIDGSGIYSELVSNVLLDEILDINMIEKFDDTLSVKSIVGEGNVTNLRVFEGQFQYSTDNGVTWINVTNNTLT